MLKEDKKVKNEDTDRFLSVYKFIRVKDRDTVLLGLGLLVDLDTNKIQAKKIKGKLRKMIAIVKRLSSKNSEEDNLITDTKNFLIRWQRQK